MHLGSTGNRPDGSRRVRLLGLVICVWLCGCSAPATPRSTAKSESPPPPPIVPSIEQDAALFDRLVSLESVFSDRAQRGLYQMLDPVAEEGMRTYAFRLSPQPGMDPARHFNLVTVTWAPAGRFVKSPATAVTTSGSGGPHGGFVDGFAQTADRAYDVRVTQGSLLPDGVEAPAVDVEKTAANMVRLYEVQRSAK